MSLNSALLSLGKSAGMSPGIPGRELTARMFLTQEGIVAQQSRTIRSCYFFLLRHSSGVIANAKEGFVRNK